MTTPTQSTGDTQNGRNCGHSYTSGATSASTITALPIPCCSRSVSRVQSTVPNHPSTWCVAFEGAALWSWNQVELTSLLQCS